MSNLFLSADVHKRDLHKVHFSAWKKGLKSLYYCRSKSIQRADVVATMGLSATELGGPVPGKGYAGNGSDEDSEIDYDECLACQ